MRVAPPLDDNRRIYVPYGVGLEVVRRLQADGWRTVRALTPEADAGAAAEARQHGCSHRLVGDTVQPV
jgi:ATP phosphoribosyltransferase regulatory subunit